MTYFYCPRNDDDHNHQQHAVVDDHDDDHDDYFIFYQFFFLNILNVIHFFSVNVDHYQMMAMVVVNKMNKIYSHYPCN